MAATFYKTAKHEGRTRKKATETEMTKGRSAEQDLHRSSRTTQGLLTAAAPISEDPAVTYRGAATGQRSTRHCPGNRGQLEA